MPPPSDNYLRESVVEAMDGSNAELFAFLPYIFQDMWEIGSSPEDFIELVRKHARGDARDHASPFRVLDIGCGKGAVSVNLARELGCACLGIDGVSEFIDEARAKADEHGVASLCDFRPGDVYNIQEELREAKELFQVVVLGSVGPILGDYAETFAACANRLAPGGVIIMEDGYIADASDFKHPPVLKRTILLSYAAQAGLKLLDETIADPAELKDADATEFRIVEQRCRELMAEHPDRKSLFENYIAEQKREYEILETKVVCATMVFGRSS